MSLAYHLPLTEDSVTVRESESVVEETGNSTTVDEEIKSTPLGGNPGLLLRDSLQI